MRSTRPAASLILAVTLLMGSDRALDGVEIQTTKSYELPGRITDNIWPWTFGSWVESKPQWRKKPLPFNRQCSGDPDCQPSSSNKKTTEVTIDAAEDATDLNLDDLPEHGVVVAKMEVTEKKHDLPEKRYGFERNKGLYYLVIDSEKKQVGAYAARRWYLVRLRKVTKWKDIVAEGWMRRCDSTQPKPANSYAGFSDCSSNSRTTDHRLISSLIAELDSAQTSLQQVRSSGQPTATADARVADVYKKLILAWINSETGPIWISCTHGCCVAEL